MGVDWPDDSPPPRRGQPRPRLDPLANMHELFEKDAGGSRFGNLLPTLIVVAILLAIGLALALAGPLPSVFPQLNCGACDIHT